MRKCTITTLLLTKTDRSKPRSEPKEEWLLSAEKLADQRAEAIKLQITSEARTQLSDVENRAKLEVDRLRDHLNQEETTASNLKSELSEARKESHGMPVSTEMAEEQAEPMKKNMKRVENVAQTQRSALQKQYESMQQFNAQ